MACIGSHHLSFFFLFALLLLLLSPQIQAREGKFFSFFTHFTTNHNNNAKQPQVVVVPQKAKPYPPTPTPAPALAPTESIVAAPAPAPESEFVDRGDGYGLYGTTSFENKDTHESFKTGYPNTRLYSNSYNNNNNEEVYRNNYFNNQEYNNHRSNNYYSNNIKQDSYYSNNNNNDRYFYNNNNYYHNNYNGYERKREGMSDTRFVENGKYFYDVKGEKENYHYNVDGYQPAGRGSTTENNNGGNYYEKNYSKYPNEFDTMEEYEKQQESQGYVP